MICPARRLKQVIVGDLRDFPSSQTLSAAE
jgi:hypothetical protein